MLQISREFLTKTSHIKNFHVLIRVLMWYGFQYDFCLLRYTSPKGCDLEIDAAQ